MTEDEYITLTDSTNIQTIIEIMRRITPEISEVINIDEYESIVNVLLEWRKEHLKLLNND